LIRFRDLFFFRNSILSFSVLGCDRVANYRTKTPTTKPSNEDDNIQQWWFMDKTTVRLTPVLGYDWIALQTGVHPHKTCRFIEGYSHWWLKPD